jgi:hypothetical protein
MSKRCCFFYFQLAKETWIEKFTLDIFTGVGPLSGWALGLCTYGTPLEPALFLSTADVDPCEELI